MRVILLLPISLLAGCSMINLNLPEPPNVSGKVDPFPADYAETVRIVYLTAAEPDALISQPQMYVPWSINEPRIWYVCLRRPKQADVEVVLHGSQVLGALKNSKLCLSEAYHPIAAH